MQFFVFLFLNFFYIKSILKCGVVGVIERDIGVILVLFWCYIGVIERDIGVIEVVYWCYQSYYYGVYWL